MKLLNDIRTNFLLCLIWFLLFGALWHNTFFGCLFYGFMVYEAANYTVHLWHTRKETTDVPT